MTDEMVSVCSFSNDSRQFILPQALDIDPSLIWDEKTEVFRISLGKTNCSEDEAALYKQLFDVLDSKAPFVEHIHFSINGYELIFSMSYAIKTIKSYGVFYELEATVRDIKYKKG